MMGDVIILENTVIDHLNEYDSVAEIVKTIEFMGDNFKELVLGAKRDDRMHDNLCVALSYIEQHGYDVKYII